VTGDRQPEDQGFEASHGVAPWSPLPVAPTARLDPVVQHLLDNAADGMLVVDGSGRVVFANTQVCAMFGYSSTELLGQLVDVFLPVEQRHEVDWARVLADAPTSRADAGLRSIRAARRDGSLLPVEVSLTKMSGPEGPVLAMVVHDVSDRARVEERAAVSRAELEAVLALGRDVVSLMDDVGRIVYLSDSVTPLTGYPREHYLERDLSDELHPDDVSLVFDAWMRIVDEPGASVVVTLRMRHRNGGWRWMECHVTNRTAELGPTGFISNMHDVTEQRRARDELRFQADLLASVGEAVVACDLDGAITYWNSAAAELYGWDAEEVLGAPLGQVLPSPDQAERAPELLAALSQSRRWTGELVVRRRDGSHVPVRAVHNPVLDDVGRLKAVITVASDATEIHAARSRLEARAEMQAEVARLGQLALGEAGLDAVLDAVTVGAARVLGLHAVSFVELHPDRPAVFRAASDGSKVVRGSPVSPRYEAFLERLLPHLGDPVVIGDMDGERRFGGELRSGSEGVAAMAAVLVRRRGEPFGVLSGFGPTARRWDADEINFLRNLANIVANTVRRDDDERELVTLALHDALTGLPNRTLLADRLEHAASRAGRDGRAVAVLLVDLDGFKVVNDALGHLVGDRLLVAAAERLQRAIRSGDTVARLGGDEFAILCEGVSGVPEAAAVASRIAELMAAPFRVGHTETFVTASIGITVRDGSDAGDASADVLLREADAAMYRAKDAGRARYEVFDDDMRLRAVQRFELTTALRHAVERDELRLLWQPEVPLAADPSQGVWAEALVRWQHPELGLLAPSHFIDLAEETGLITEIGWWVLREACTVLAGWDGSDGPAPGLISVNMSARQLAQPDLVDAVAAILVDTGVDPSRIMLEITETAVMADAQASAHRLAGLRALGLGVAIDDFGTGYSSLTYLRQLPVNVLKVDRSFVSGLGTSLEDHAIVKGIIALARAVGLLTVAEGVESEDQRRELTELGCDWAQGYLWSRPVTSEDLQRWIATREA
jgi:diguanylate cyclase (GGDEF)-like protein/PAS domain S-box-containing protein